MRRLITFLFGTVVGALLLYAALNFHVIRASDGFHLVRKVDSTLAGAYVDVRQFTPADWVQQSQVAEALVRANRTDLMESSVRDSLRRKLDGILAPQP